MPPAKENISTRNIPTMSRNELEREWNKARECFEQALAQKTEADRVYLAAASQLNALERVVKKVAKQEARARRRAARSLLTMA